ncbi:hypothetical protein LTR17_008725 [Elasticomyces elasticus]|nr:hypothetical protein LTR17_008725 [Elasticomyces elasticus]
MPRKNQKESAASIAKKEAKKIAYKEAQWEKASALASAFVPVRTLVAAEFLARVAAASFSPEVEEPPAKRRCVVSPARHSPQATFIDFDLSHGDDGPAGLCCSRAPTPEPFSDPPAPDDDLLRRIVERLGEPSLDSTLQPSFNSVEPATSAVVGRPKIILKLKAKRPQTSDTTQRNIDRSTLPGWALGDSGLSQTAPRSNFVDFTGGDIVGEQGEFTTPHAHSPGVGNPDNSLGELYIAPQQSTDLERGTASPRPGFDFGESFNIPPSGEARQQATDGPASRSDEWKFSLAGKQATLDSEMWVYLWEVCAVRPEQCHDRMFEQCGRQDHLVRYLEQPNTHRLARDTIACHGRIAGTKQRGHTGVCVPQFDIEGPQAKSKAQATKTIRWKCPDCKDTLNYAPTLSRWLAMVKLSEGQRWKAAIKRETGGQAPAFECTVLSEKVPQIEKRAFAEVGPFCGRTTN